MAGNQNGYVFPPPRGFMPEQWPQQHVNLMYMDGFASYPPPRGPNIAPRPGMLHGNQFVNGMVPRFGFDMQVNNSQQHAYGPNVLTNHDSQRPVFNQFSPRFLGSQPLSSNAPGNCHVNQRFRFRKTSKQQNSYGPSGNSNGLMKNGGKLIKESESSVQEAKKAFSCEPCDKEFKTQEHKDAHVKEHVKCEFEGCSFVASRKANKLHFIQNHEEGKFRILLKDDEDIRKWKEERKKNYPSQSRKKEKKENEEKNARKGNVLQTRSFSYRGNDSWRVKDQKRQINDGKEMNNNCRKAPETSSKINETNQIELANQCNSSSNSETGQAREKREEKQDALMILTDDNKTKQSALAALQSIYDSTSSSEDEGDEESHTSQENKEPRTGHVKSSHPKQIEPDNECLSNETNDVILVKGSRSDVATLSCKETQMVKESLENILQQTDDNGLEKSNITKSCVDEEGFSNVERNFSYRNLRQQRTNSNNDRKRQQPKNGASAYSRGNGKRFRKPTLLEMLLAKDIRRERNTVLQCIRHILSNGFFDV